MYVPRICTNAPSRGLVLSLRCYTTLADQVHTRSFRRPLDFDNLDAQETQPLQEKKNLHTRDNGSLPGCDLYTGSTANAESGPRLFSNVAIEPFPRSFRHNVEGSLSTIRVESSDAAALELKKSVVVRDTDYGTSRVSSLLGGNDHKKALQSFVSKLDKRVGVVRFHPHMEDHTCARFFATTFFSVEFMLEGMALFGIAELGSLSIQEIIKRTIRGHHCDSAVAQQYFARMYKLGIKCSTRYGRLLEHLANQGKEVLLYSTVTSDFHPDMYDDLELQDNLLRSQDMAIVERTRICLSFEMGKREVEIRNLMLRAGFESIDLMVADGIPVLFETRAALLESIYLDRSPWISETRLRVLARVFMRLPHVTAQEWRHIIVCFMYIIRPHLRRDLESLLLGIRMSEVFDDRLVSDMIRWYLRLGSLAQHPSIEAMIGGIRVLAALRDQGTALNIQGSCEANLMSIFGDTFITEKIDIRKRIIARRLGTMEDFITAIREIWGPDLWPGLSPSEIKERIFVRGKELGLRRRQMSGISQGLSPHTGSYNPGKVRYLRKQIRETTGRVEKSSTG